MTWQRVAAMAILTAGALVAQFMGATGLALAFAGGAIASFVPRMSPAAEAVAQAALATVASSATQGGPTAPPDAR